MSERIVIEVNNQQWMEKLNLRGRMAYAITSFETAVCEHDTVTPPMKLLIDSLWEFTSIKDLSAWDKSINSTIYAADSDEENYKSFKKKYLRDNISDYNAKYLYETLGCVIDVARASLIMPYQSADTMDALELLCKKMDFYDRCALGYLPYPWDFKQAYMDEPDPDGKVDVWGQPIRREDFKLKPIANKYTKCEQYIYKVSDYFFDHLDEWQCFVREKKFYNECLDLINLNIFENVPAEKMAQWRKDACDFGNYDKEKMESNRKEFVDLVCKKNPHPFSEPGSKDFTIRYETYSCIMSLLSQDDLAVSGDPSIEYFSLDMIHLFKIDEAIIEGLLKKYFLDVVDDQIL